MRRTKSKKKTARPVKGKAKVKPTSTAKSKGTAKPKKKAAKTKPKSEKKAPLTNILGPATNLMRLSNSLGSSPGAPGENRRKRRGAAILKQKSTKIAIASLSSVLLTGAGH